MTIAAGNEMLITQTKRLVLRELRATDAHAFCHVFGDREVMFYSDGIKSMGWVNNWLDSFVSIYYTRWGFGIWAVVEKESDAVIGYCGLTQFPDRCQPEETEIGYRLRRSHWGRGLATEAVLVVQDYARNTLKYPQMIAIIDPGNAISVRVALKAGFHYEREIMFDGYSHPDHLYSIDFGVPKGLMLA